MPNLPGRTRSQQPEGDHHGVQQIVGLHSIAFLMWFSLAYIHASVAESHLFGYAGRENVSLIWRDWMGACYGGRSMKRK